MADDSALPHVASLLGDPARSRMMSMLMNGQARTAGELALDGGVAASTASSHLSQLLAAGLVEVVKQGRHRYFRLASADVAAAIESLMGAAQTMRRTGPVDPQLRKARACYDHLAGQLAVEWAQAMQQRGYLQCDDGMVLTQSGAKWCAGFGIDIAALRLSRRTLCRPCLDWSERRDHVAGALGSALLQRLFATGHARLVPDSRAIIVSARGERLLRTLDQAG